MATKEELKAKAAELGVAVTRSDGGAGEPTVADYESAISAHEAGIEAPTSPAGTSSFKVTSPFKIFDHRRGQTITGEVKEHDETGARILVVGSEWALLDPLLEAGWLEEVSS